ncbi:GFA family protein [Bradyrhizobium sp. U87765 SZCCT0131]|uniref:GFA family protein n=1 Tax=unclassified Bradyrhizobium TaxID=2631580 RepID=UPI001BAB1142|nr:MULTISPECIES: GFA family protein [unclassified Bradyrhizobium]MBR1219808.1 GFA family protein [Bradyrhizobium sp. U87765 SZCCT0131]MBR1262459.1 GFA family protein [Bradyrhizobium sp. U87765 SZCCT0134]MBR1308358.1 GFA family protein [Bradyrhizobium sp. U87765 SZCCT0110]MBR1318241.1 GFA family protein [Bradyrhizobium sp. U87765 SZCCT0109]MBR1351944.1 GFA family protein [Bradyrhizobium sp. U87765 SZCCT0048]
MSETRTFTGGCHCGQVRFECTTDLATVTACNCSICTKKGLHFTFLPLESFQLRAGAESLKEYLFNKHAIRHQICNECGVEVFARGRKPDGAEIVAVNVATIDHIDLASLTMTPIDGRNR